MPQKCKDAIDEYRRDVNPARAFLLANYVAGLDYAGLPTQEVHNSYVLWCGRNGYRPMNAANFGKEVKRTLPGIRNERKRDRGRRVTVYQGMAVKEDSEVATETIGTCPGWS
jgi:phage/plasmid-associated DNA primase